ncbi:hypothetical protein [Mycobacterium sp. URHB0044]|uniref:hypothetical protein n=1 Tax=Mycobacterium sp. URHB0044 TaxID=1380386 RepID=UPI00048AB004|nr:hypothetical protein [Mycobacterium sp. URHB0044]
MGRTNVRVAAGAGAIAAFVLFAGSTVPVVSADPGHSRHGNGSHRGNDDGYDQQRGRGGRFDVDRTDGRGGDSDAGRVAASDPTPTFGNQRSPENNRSSPTDRSTPVFRQPSTSRGASAATQPGDQAAPPAADGGGGSGGAAVTGSIGSSFTQPRVTVGNGRSPGILSGQPREAPSPAAPVETPAPAPPPPAPAPPPTVRLEEPMLQRAVSSLWAAAAPYQPGGVLFGLAGLVLAPLAGAWLGFRQARASKAAAQLVRR